MNARRQQLGMSLPGIIAIMVMVGFFIMCVIRMSPPYFEYLSVRDIMGRLVMEELDNRSGSQIRRVIETRFNTNQIYELDAKDVKIYNKKGKTYIDASYEVRLPIAWRVDAVLKFDDLLYELGNPEPSQTQPAGKK